MYILRYTFDGGFVITYLKYDKGVNHMTITAQNWGNSIGVRIPKKIAEKFEIENGTELEVSEVS